MRVLPATCVAEAALYRWRWAALVVLLIAEAMNLLDATIVQVAAPTIHAHLPGPASDVQWFSAAYTLPFALGLMPGGRLGDIVGRVRAFRLGSLGFVLASLACALSPTSSVLIGARVVQGAAAALIIPQTFGLIRAMFEADERARALGSIGPVMGLAALLGPVLGGLLTHADIFGTSWRSVFLVNVPLGLCMLVAATLLREDRPARRPTFDSAGALLASLGMGLLVYPLVQSGTFGWTLETNAWLALGGLVLAAFAIHQRWLAWRGRRGLVEARLFADAGFPAALACVLLVFGVLTGLILVVELQLQLGLQADVLTGGLTLVPWSVASAIASWTAGAWLVPRVGPALMLAGLALLCVGLVGVCLVYAVWPAALFPWPVLVALAICGLGGGTFSVPFFTLALSRVDSEASGSASGLLNAVQELGSTLGVAVLGSVYFAMPAGWGAATALAAAVALVLVAMLSAHVMLGTRERASS